MVVIAGTGSNSTAEALRLTRFAEKHGADAALVVAQLEVPLARFLANELGMKPVEVGTPPMAVAPRVIVTPGTC